MGFRDAVEAWFRDTDDHYCSYCKRGADYKRRLCGDCAMNSFRVVVGSWRQPEKSVENDENE